MLCPSDLDLHNKEASAQYYDGRYSRKVGFLSSEYMAEWNEEKKERVFDLIRKLNLPARGEALDFGCGSGVLTELIREALPQYKVYGTDLSHKALDRARERYPRCAFFHTADAKHYAKKFDFLFTHHVLEHVYDVQKVAGEIAKYLKPASTMLHILPCGNEGSLEYNLCRLRKDGINDEKDGVFFFEDEGHVRRLTTVGANKIFMKYNFKLVEGYYSNQYFGAIKWITESNPFRVLKMVNPFYSQDSKAKMQLLKTGVLLVGLNLLRLPIILMKRIELNKQKDLIRFLIYTTCLMLYPLSWPLDRYVRKAAAAEWPRRQKEGNGSEMYLVYSRAGSDV
jgi:SAM-dependent methyltransferase